MPLRVRIASAPAEASVHEFDDSQAEVRIGRDPARCQIVLPADDTRVSAEHCSLLRVPGGYRLRTNRERRVYVDGVLAHDDQDLPAVHEVALGDPGGPTLVVESLVRSGLAPTKKPSRREPSPRSELRAANVRISSARRTSFLSLAGALLTALGGVVGFRIAHARAVGAEGEARRASVDVGQLTVQVLQDRERARARFQPAAGRVRDSVYLVARREDPDSKGALVPRGTAWVVARGRLATNAHVAEEFGRLEGAQSLVVVGKDGVEHRVERVSVHPGYARFPALVADRHVYDSPEDRILTGTSLPYACDVATMDVAEDSAGGLGPPLQLASDEELLALAQGERLAFLGFPQEGLVKGGVSLRRPQPTFQEGALTGSTGFFLEDAEPPMRFLIHFSMTAAGGASGSPVFTQDGKVVGILSAGNFAHLPQQPRIPIGGVAYGQRIDLLRELLDAREPDRLLDRHERAWESELDALFALGTDGLLVALERQLRSTEGDVARVGSEAGRVTGSGIGGAARIDLLPRRTGKHFVLVVADEDVPIEAYVLREEAIVSEGGSAGYFAVAAFQGRAGEPVRLVVLGEPDPGRAIAFRARVFEAGP